MKIQKATMRETLRIAAGVTVFSIVMNIVFAVIGQWDYKVLLGTLLGGTFAVANFLAMGLTVQKIAANPDVKKGKMTFQFSYSLRQFLMFAVVAVGLLVPVFNGIAVVLTQLFPKFTILFLQITGAYKPEKNTEEAQDEG